MKKNLALLISIIALFSCLYFLRLSIEKDGLLKGNQIADFLYEYKLNEEEKEWNGYYIKDKEIYYLSKENNNYLLYKRDITKEKSIKIKEFNNNDSCNLVRDYISCNNDSKITLYNYEYQKLYETIINDSEDYPKIIKYKDIYIKYINNTLYINQNNKEKTFRELPEELENTFIEDYYVEKNNTYLLLYNINEKTYYIYDINKNEYKEIKSKNSYKYNNGFYFYDKDKYQVINLKANKEQEFPNLLENEYNYTSTLNNNILYYFNIIDDEINILDLEKGILKKIKLEITKENNLSNIILYKNYLYFEIGDNTGNIYILDLDNVKYEETNLIEKKKQEEENLAKQIYNLKEIYNVNVHIKKETDIKFPDFNAETETNNNKILATLNKINNIIKKYDKEVFNNFYFNNYEGLHIYLTSSLTPSNLENQISNPAAYSLVNNNKFMIVIDINQENIEELLCHELLHNIEFALTKKGLTPFNNWDILNPSDFNYNNSYTIPYTYNYTLEEDNKNNIYFIDKYSHTYASEDRSRIFENICACNTNSIIKDYPHLYKKAIYLEEELYKYYPILKETNLFDSLK